MESIVRLRKGKTCLPTTTAKTSEETDTDTKASFRPADNIIAD
jgi:hypothetical protein